MTQFEIQLSKLAEEAEELKKKENSLRAEQQLFLEKQHGFFKEHGLSDNFTAPELAMLAVRKSKLIVTP